MLGVIFDVKEFALNDGEGIRTTVFFKGCPLRCIWCHNPEGLSPRPELFEKRGCTGCGLCRRGCTHADCQPFGRCLHVCPQNLLRVAGTEWESEALAEHLLKKADLYAVMGGGVTLSGGEPLLQAAFCSELLDRLAGKMHRAVETCGYAERADFERVIGRSDFLFMDLKLYDAEAHREFTGVSNEKILANAAFLRESGIPHRFRIPLIPGITDTHENLSRLSEVAGDSPVELLGYNRLAPAKYAGVRRTFTDRIDGAQEVNADLSLFQNAILRR